jgi:bla regulator protein BlaR1
MTPWLPLALMNHLWQSTLFVLLAWLVTGALRKNGARVRYWIWTAAALKFLVPLSTLVKLGEQFQWRAAPAGVQPAVSFVMQEVLAPATVVGAAPASIPQTSSLWPWLLMAVWCVGAAAVLVSWWRQWLPIRSALRHATPVRLDAQYGGANLVVMSSPSMPEPGVVGIRRPRLLLPDGIIEQLTPPQLRALIAHERCHIDCHDNLVAAIQMAVESIFWFHPVVWWIERRLIEERERACDEAVLRAGSRPQDYAEGILKVCRQSIGLRPACVAGVSGSNLRARVEAIMRSEIGRPLTPGRRWALAIAIVAAVGVPVAGGVLQSQVVVPPALAFEVASVTPSTLFRGLSAAPPSTLGIQAYGLKRALSGAREGELKLTGSLQLLIQAAYDVTRFQVEGGPSWVLSDPFDIEARARDDATPDEIRSMLQSLLADRFQLTLRRERRQLPVYELEVANGGLKIAATKEGDCIPPKEVRWDLIDLEAPLFVCGGGRRRALSQNPETRPLPQWPRVDRIEMGHISMSALIDLISGDLDRVVIDKTRFAEPFNLLLDFAPPSNPESRLPAYSGPTLFTALEGQLGLALRSTTASVDALVIDRAERPSEN